MVKEFPYRTGKSVRALDVPGWFVWDTSVIKSGGKYHMFSSRWKHEYGFGASWLYFSEIVHSVSDTPEGPYTFANVVLSARGPQYFDGMNTHNTCIREYKGKFYLYYMGCTYGTDIPAKGTGLPQACFEEVWNRKRIGLAVADDINGEFVRSDSPLLMPRDCSHWDCTITTNPSVTILPNGKTYMIYKSRRGYGYPLQLGVAYADKPDGKFERLTEGPILQFENRDFHIEDPFMWYDEKRSKFCLLAKDDSKNGSYGITGEWGSGFYAESDDCINFEIADVPKAYSRKCLWEDGSETVQCNMERPSLLFDENGCPTHLFTASGNGDVPYGFDKTYIICTKLEAK